MIKVFTKDQVRQMPVLDSVVCNYGNHKVFHHYYTLYDYCGELCCIDLIAPDLDSIIIYLNSINIKVNRNSIKSITKGEYWTFQSNGIPYQIYKLDKVTGMPQQFYKG